MRPVVLAILAVLALTCWTMTAVKLRDLLRRPDNLPLRYLCLGLLAITAGLTVQPVAARLDRWLGVLDLGRLAGNCLAVVAVAAGQGLLLLLISVGEPQRRRVRRRMLVMAACVTAMVVLFLLTPARYGLDDLRVRSGVHYDATPTLFAAPYTLVYLGYLAWAAVEIMISTGYHARISPNPLLRLGMRLIGAGVAFALGYATIKIVAMVLVTTTRTGTPALDWITVLLYATSILAVLFGATVPSWGPRLGLDRLLHNVIARSDCRRLEPLWQVLYAAVPEIALLPHPTEPSLRRVRLTVEVLDGCVRLGPWMPPHVERQRTARDPEAAAAAALLATAIRAKLSGVPAKPDTSAMPLPGTDAAPASQVRWLVRVSRVIRRSSPGLVPV